MVVQDVMGIISTGGGRPPLARKRIRLALYPQGSLTPDVLGAQLGHWCLAEDMNWMDSRGTHWNGEKVTKKVGLAQTVHCTGVHVAFSDICCWVLVAWPALLFVVLTLNKLAILESTPLSLLVQLLCCGLVPCHYHPMPRPLDLRSPWLELGPSTSVAIEGLSLPSAIKNNPSYVAMVPPLQASWSRSLMTCPPSKEDPSS
jgi:hypothetical protein